MNLNLPTGEKKSLIELTWRTAGKVKNIHDIFIATDDTRIATAARAFGAKVIMTSSQCRNGTERCAEAVDNAKLDADLIINFQGDAPLTPPWFVESLIKAMDKDDKSSKKSSKRKREKEDKEKSERSSSKSKKVKSADELID